MIVGLCGGVASGKSTIARLFEEHGLERIDADAIARAVSAEPAVLQAIEARFGRAALDPAGTALDRAALGRLVFADAAARRDLEAITHPRIRVRIEAALAAARASGRPVVLDVPLLFEGGLWERCDEIGFVDVPDAVRGARAAARGWDAGELARREAAQLPLAVKRSRSTFIISAAGPVEYSRRQVARLIASWRAAGRLPGR